MTIYRPIPLKETDKPGSSVLKGGDCPISTGTLKDEGDLSDSSHELTYEVDNLGLYFDVDLGIGENFLYTSDTLTSGEPLIFYSNSNSYPEAISPDEVYFVNSISGGNFDLVDANGAQVNITDLHLGDLRVYHAFSLTFDCPDGQFTVEDDYISKRSTTDLVLPSGESTIYRLSDIENVSITSWVKWDGSDYTVFSSEKFDLSINPSGNLVVDYSGAPTIQSTDTLDLGWHHVAVTYLSDTQDLRLYIDGEHDSLHENIILPVANNYLITFGDANQDFRLYDRMLYWSEVEELASTRPLLNSDNANIDLYRDSVPDSYVRVFNGATQYAYASTAFNSNLDGSQSFTLSAKYKTNTGVSSNGGVILINKGTGSPSNIGFQIALPSTGLVFARLADGTSNIYLGDTIPTDDDIWHTVTLVYDQVAQTASLYVDDRAITTLSTAGLGLFGPVNVNARFGIGALTYTTGSNYHYYIGRLRDVRVYNTACNVDQVNAIHQGIILPELSTFCLLHTWLDSPHPEKDWDASGNNEVITVVNRPTIVTDNEVGLNRRAVYGSDNTRTIQLPITGVTDDGSGATITDLGNNRYRIQGDGITLPKMRGSVATNDLNARDEVVNYSIFVESCSPGLIEARCGSADKSPQVTARQFTGKINDYEAGGWSSSFFRIFGTDVNTDATVRIDQIESHHAFAPRDQSIITGHPQSILGSNLTILGNKDWKYSSIDGGALQMSGVERIVLPDSIWNTDGSEEIEIEFWARLVPTGSIQYILYNYLSSPGIGWQIYLNTNNRIRFFVRDGIGSDASDSQPVVDGQWAHYRLHYSSGNDVNNAIWYVNDIENPWSGVGGAFGSMDAPTALTTIGSAGASGSSRFTSEIANLKVKIGGQLISYFPFDERSGSTVYDVQDNAAYTIETYTSDVVNRATQTSVYYTDVFGYNGSSARIPASYSINKQDVLGAPIENKPLIYPNAGLLFHRYDKNYLFNKVNRSGISVNSVNDSVEYGIANFTGDLDVYIENCEEVIE